MEAVDFSICIRSIALGYVELNYITERYYMPAAIAHHAKQDSHCHSVSFKIITVSFLSSLATLTSL